MLTAHKEQYSLLGHKVELYFPVPFTVSCGHD